MLFTIDETMMAAFKNSRRDDFTRRAIDFVRGNLSGLEQTTDDTLQKQLGFVMREVETLNVTSEQSIIKLFCACILKGQNVLVIPIIRNALHDNRIPETDRIAKAISYL